MLDTIRPMVLAWLGDAAMFMDDPQITAFYDAVIRPEFQEGTVEVDLAKTTQWEGSVKVAAEAEMGVAGWLKTVFPFIDAKGTLKGEGQGAVTKTTLNGEKLQLHAIDNPHRQLVQLALHYATEQHSRLVTDDLGSGADKRDWESDAFIQQVPRALAFFDCPPGTMFIPVAAEVDRGSVVTFYDELIKRFAVQGKDFHPKYRESKPGDDPAEVREDRAAYWEWFASRFDATDAMRVVEGVIAEGGRPRWIDYRVPYGKGGALHLHVQARERYDTGTFAYNFVKRGYKHGLRLIGTLKTEPDLNVLAVFER